MDRIRSILPATHSNLHHPAGLAPLAEGTLAGPHGYLTKDVIRIDCPGRIPLDPGAFTGPPGSGMVLADSPLRICRGAQGPARFFTSLVTADPLFWSRHLRGIAVPINSAVRNHRPGPVAGRIPSKQPDLRCGPQQPPLRRIALPGFRPVWRYISVV